MPGRSAWVRIHKAQRFHVEGEIEVVDSNNNNVNAVPVKAQAQASNAQGDTEKSKQPQSRSKSSQFWLGALALTAVAGSAWLILSRKRSK